MECQVAFFLLPFLSLYREKKNSELLEPPHCKPMCYSLQNLSKSRGENGNFDVQLHDFFVPLSQSIVLNYFSHQSLFRRD